MHLGQIKPNGTVIAAVFADGLAHPIPGHTMLDLIRRAAAEHTPLANLAAELASRHGDPAVPVLPVNPPEVWACGCTYETSATFRDAETGTREGLYAHVYREPRPEIFMKGTSRHCVPSGQAIGLRCDARFTAPEPELALVLGAHGKIEGYTLANDVSAWDIERENALYLPQSKIYNGCCALGPVMATVDEIGDPYNLEIACTVVRGDATIFSGSVNTGKLHRKFDSLLEYLLRANNVPAGTVLLTGTGIIVPERAALQPGDVVTISVPEIGELTNPTVVVG
jgi:2-dehydro-3-deoxy-D-arabinonate dehydratase